MNDEDMAKNQSKHTSQFYRTILSRACHYEHDIFIMTHILQAGPGVKIRPGAGLFNVLTGSTSCARIFVGRRTPSERSLCRTSDADGRSEGHLNNSRTVSTCTGVRGGLPGVSVKASLHFSTNRNGENVTVPKHGEDSKRRTVVDYRTFSLPNETLRRWKWVACWARNCVLKTDTRLLHCPTMTNHLGLLLSVTVHLACSTLCVEGRGRGNDSLLFHHLFEHYDSALRPVREHQDVLTVDFGVTLTHIVDMCQGDALKVSCNDEPDVRNTLKDWVRIHRSFLRFVLMSRWSGDYTSLLQRMVQLDVPRVDWLQFITSLHCQKELATTETLEVPTVKTCTDVPQMACQDAFSEEPFTKAAHKRLITSPHLEPYHGNGEAQVADSKLGLIDITTTFRLEE
ncbi:acetylcholine-gated cation-selective channel [Branchiostoma belcheri]|nr:acetylcholine-gated cation-selective channel [Branchiostoma belcheri]